MKLGFRFCFWWDLSNLVPESGTWPGILGIICENWPWNLRDIDTIYIMVVFFPGILEYPITKKGFGDLILGDLLQTDH